LLCGKVDGHRMLPAEYNPFGDGPLRDCPDFAKYWNPNQVLCIDLDRIRDMITVEGGEESK